MLVGLAITRAVARRRGARAARAGRRERDRRHGERSRPTSSRSVTPVVATADVVADATRRRAPTRSASRPTSRRTRSAGRADRRARRSTGDTARVVFRYPLRCLREGCDPAAARGVAQFEPGLVRYRFRDSSGRRARHRRLAARRGRVARARGRRRGHPLARERDRAPGRDHALRRRRGSPSCCSSAPLRSSAPPSGSVGASGTCPAPEASRRGRASTRPPLERALELVLAELGNGAASPDRRRALERVARELTASGTTSSPTRRARSPGHRARRRADEVESFARARHDVTGAGCAA